MMNDAIKKSDGWFILICFVMFFGLIIVVNSIFIYQAINTNSGVVIAQPYEKGLGFNKTLEKARSQPDIEKKVFYKAGILRWELPVNNAVVTAKILRPVQDGYDFDIILTHIGGGVYETKPALPMPGAWTAKMKATWDNQEFQISHDFIAK